MGAAKRRPKIANNSPVMVGGGMVQENLPFPCVYYPSHYGTFFAFAETATSPAVMCACSKGSVLNYLRLREISPLGYSDELGDAWFSDRHFPEVISRLSLNSIDPLSTVIFVEKLCHWCNLKPPTYSYCHEMYGGQFIQHFGWYVNQQYFRLGIDTSGNFPFLPDVCPLEHQKDILIWREINEEFQKEYQRLEEIMKGPKREDIPPNEPTYWTNVRMEEAEKMIKLRRQSSQAHRTITKKIEDIVRQEFGFKKVGEGWVSETLLFHIVQRIFDGEEIYRHYRPDWLDGLELDIYLPNLRIGLEYQGKQHFHPIKAWGGEKGLQKVQERDAKKSKICKELNVNLIEIDYTEPLTEEHIRHVLSKQNMGRK